MPDDALSDASQLALSSLISVMTGTSWTTIATIGIALLGIGDALGIPAIVYMPFCFFNIISPVMSCLVAALGFVPTPKQQKEE